MRHLIITFFLLYILSLNSATADESSGQWTARWISHPECVSGEFGVYYFKKKIVFDQLPKHLKVHVSADNRYRFYVNGSFVGFGPATGDLDHWHFETYNIARFLKSGDNVIAAMVWNMGKYSGAAQLSNQTGFILQCDDDSSLNSSDRWVTRTDPAFSPIPVVVGKDVRGGFLAPACIEINGIKHDWNWKSPDTDESWTQAVDIGAARMHSETTGTRWGLIKRPIPMLEMRKERIYKLIQSSGLSQNLPDFKEKVNITIPPFKKVQLLLDNSVLTVGFPEMIVSGGEGSAIKISYAEALFEKGQRDEFGNLIGEGQIKGNRNITKGKEFVGYHDRFIADGGDNRLFRPLWWRTFRYVLLEIETQEQPLTIEDFYNIFTAYPFQQNAVFKADDDVLRQIWDVSWRTARLCAWETYMDCPYYEQLQYIGDTRIQALVSLYVSGDDRLMRNAIRQFHDSITPDGLTRSAHPCQQASIIPPFSLFWIGMVHDYWMHRTDDNFIKQFIPAIIEILNWHEQYIDSRTGMFSKIPYWNFVDWTSEWPWDVEKQTGGMPDGWDAGNSSVLTLQYIYIATLTVEILEAFGEHPAADHFSKITRELGESTYEYCRDSEKRFIADTPQKTSFSQHANVMAVLAGIIPESEQGEFIERVVDDMSLIQCTIYYRFYLNRALIKAGRGDLYTKLLSPWTDMLALGLTTFAEKPEPSRSDCHGWSASPNCDFLSIVCGIQPASPGFNTVKIEPHPGDLSFVEGAVPHPNGDISMKYRRKEKTVTFLIELPDGLTGSFVWQGEERAIAEGENEFEF